jgi:predicted  nucleic acid-binding Zn-ribbon protein
MSVRDKNFYEQFEKEMDAIEDMFAVADEDVSNPATADLVASMERQKAVLMAKKTKLQQQLDATDKEIQRLDGQIGLKKSS